MTAPLQMDTTATSDHSSIQEVWKLLEQGSNISIKSSTSDAVAGKLVTNEGDLEIFGEPIKTREVTRGRGMKKSSTKLPLKKKEQKKAIRNYNQRD